MALEAPAGIDTAALRRPLDHRTHQRRPDTGRLGIPEQQLAAGIGREPSA